MEHLLEELFQRWRRAFDELEVLPQYKAQIKTTQYAVGYRYSLDKFDGAAFPSGGELTPNKNDSSLHPYVESGFHGYGINDKGLPCYTSFTHNYNQIAWEGYYSYADNLVEYVEFIPAMGIPYKVQRIQYQDGHKVSWQHISLNGAAPVYAQMSTAEIIKKVENDPYSYVLTVTSFEYGPTGKIDKSFSIHNAPGLGRYTSHDEYTYDHDQNLETIRTFFEQGSNRLTYCRIPENTSPEALTVSLAAAMAKAILAALASQPPEQPIALLELCYHYGDSYSPLLGSRSTREVADQLGRGSFSFLHNYDSAPDVDMNSIERPFAQLEQMMAEQGNGSLGRIMLRKTAAILTENKLFGQLSVSEDFAAYAIDWSIEGHSDEDFEEILGECGVGIDQLNTWRMKGMIPGR